MIRVIAAAILLLVATPALALDDADYSAAVVATAKNAIIPAYQAFGESAKRLQDRLDALCKAPDGIALQQARYDFGAIATSWAQIQYVSFGPIFEHQRAFRIEYWPDKRNVVGRQLAEVLKKQDVAALEPQRFATTTVGVQGLPALERLLFEDDALAELSGSGAAFRCSLFAAISSNLETIARDVVAGWTEGQSAFLSRVEHPSEVDEEIPNGRDAAGRLLNDLLTATIAMRDMKLLAPLGNSLEKAKPNTAEYWRSGQSIAALAANLEGWRALFAADGGLGALLAAQPGGKTTAIQVEALFWSLKNSIAAIGLSTNTPLHQAILDPARREAIKTMAEKLATLRDLVAGPVATQLNLPIGFNALDGD